MLNKTPSAALEAAELCHSNEHESEVTEERHAADAQIRERNSTTTLPAKKIPD